MAKTKAKKSRKAAPNRGAAEVQSPEVTEAALAKGKAGRAVTKKSKKDPKPKAPKLTPEQRRAKQQADDAVVRQAGGVVRNSAGRLSARDLPCLCGCGEDTVTRDAWFVSGHDAKLRKRLLEGEEIPQIIRPFFEVEGQVIAALMLEDGEIVDMKATA